LDGIRRERDFVLEYAFEAMSYPSLPRRDVFRIAYMGVDVEAVLMAKHEYNKGREYRHGGKRA
jgi:hypothetical protein